VKREDGEIELVGNELTIKGQVVERERHGVLPRRTRRTGRYEYRATLPDQVDGDKIDAGLKDGVLTVRAPKAQKAERRRIEVKT